MSQGLVSVLVSVDFLYRGFSRSSCGRSKLEAAFYLVN